MRKLLYLIALLPLFANAQDVGKYIAQAGGTFTEMKDLRLQRGTDGIAVTLLMGSTDSTHGKKLDGLGGQLFWCDTCKYSDDGYFIIKPTVGDQTHGNWVRVIQSLNTTWPVGTYNRFVIDSNGRIARAFIDTTAIYALNLARTKVSKDTLANFAKQSDLAGVVHDSDLESAMSFIEGQVSMKANQAGLDSANMDISVGLQTLRLQDSTEIAARLKTVDTTNKWQAKGSYLTVESDPIWNAQKVNYLTTASALLTYQIQGNYALNPRVLADSILFRSLHAQDSLSIAGKQATGDYATNTRVTTLHSQDSIAIAGKQPSGSYLTSEVDGSTTNELQTISGTGNTVSLSNGGGSYTIPAQAYSSLTGLPNIPSNTNQLTNGAGFIISYTETDPIWTAQKTSYMRYVDTASLSNRIDGKQAAGSYATTTALALKVSYTDTASMFSSYQRTATANATYQPIGSYATTTNLALKVNYTDTASMLSPYMRSVAANATFATISGLNSKFNTADTIGKWISKASADLTYKAIGYVPAWGEVTGKPTFATVASTGSYTDLISKPTFATVATSGAYSDLSGTPTITNYSAGSGIAIASGVISNTAQYVAPTFNNAPSLTIGTAKQISTTRNAHMSYTVSVASAVSVGQAIAYLEISSNGTTWVTINSAGETSVALLNTKSYNIQGDVPAGWYVRIRSALTLGGAVTYVSGQEVTY